MACIYKLYHKRSNAILYIGKTTQPLESRLAQHRKNPCGYMMRNYVKINGSYSFNIELLEYISPLDNIDERETYWINELEPMFNVAKTNKFKLITKIN